MDFVQKSCGEAQTFLQSEWLEGKWVNLVAVDKSDALQWIRSHAR
jgi:hypothetical protein